MAKGQFPTDKFQAIETPFYYYDAELLRRTLKAINDEAGKHEGFVVHYAVKANANPRVLRIIREAGLGADCVSGGEVEASVKAGFPSNKIVYAGVGKSDWEIRLGLENNIFSFNVESQAELDVINSLAKKSGKVANICLRINPDVGAHTHSNITTGLAENKFGISLDSMLEAIEYTNSLSHVNFRGLHFHIGSQILDMDDFKSLCIRINEIQNQLDSHGLKADIINVGGGLGIDYVNPNENSIPDFKSYFSTFRDNLILRAGQEVHFELGRSIVGQCGSLITQALYIKEAKLKKFIMVDAGMTELIRPALYNAYHKIENISRTENTRLSEIPKSVIEEEIYDVVGPICESSDVFVRDYKMPKTYRHDILAIRSAGAYGEAMASCYNCRRLPESYSLEELS